MRPNIFVTLGNLRSARPDLLLLDVVPYRDDAGLLLERIAADDDLRHLPIILASTSVGVAERLAEAFGNQVLDVLPKPFDLDAFFTRVNRAFASKRTS